MATVVNARDVLLQAPLCEWLQSRWHPIWSWTSLKSQDLVFK
jgi:hypothetical protein